MGGADASRKHPVKIVETQHVSTPSLEHVNSHMVENKRVQEAKDQLYQSIMENAFVAVTLIDRNYTIRMVNEVAGRWYDKPASEHIGRKCFCAFERRQSVCPHCPGQRAMETGRPAQSHREAVRDDGSHFPVRLQTFPTFDHDGQVAGFIEILEDLTEREKAERERDRILNLSRDLICIAGMDGYFRYVNPAWEKTLGYSQEELLSKPFLHFIHPDDHAKNDTEIEKLAAGHQTVDFENRYIHKDGTIRSISWRSTPIPAENLMYCIGRDVTEHKQADERILQEKEFSEKVINSLPSTFYMFDKEGRIIRWNKNFEKVSGYSPEEIAQKTIMDYIPDSYREGAFNAIQKVFTEGEACIESQALTKSGEEIPYLYTASRVNIGNETYLLGTGIDISERKRAEEKLLESEEKFRSLIENALSVILYLSPDCRILEFNHEAERLYGRKREDVLGENYLELFIPEDIRDAVAADINKVLEGKPTREFENPVKTQDGSLRDIVWNVDRVLDSQGQPSGIVAVGLDITDRKQAEEKLRESEERLDLAITGTNQGMWDWNVKTGDVTYSERSAKMLGYELDELAPDISTWNVLLHPEDKDRVMEILNQHFENDDFEYNTEFRLKTKSGGWRWINSRGRVFDRDKDQKPLRMVGTHVDITERKQVDEALRASERNYREIFNVTNEAIFVHDAETGAILDVNRTMLDMFGYSYDEALRLDVGDLSLGEPPYTQKDAEGWVRRAFEEGPQTFEWHARRKNGELFWDETNLKLATIGGQKRILAVVRDITERKKAEKALREREEQLRLAVKGAQLATWDWDLRTDVIRLGGLSQETLGIDPDIESITLADFMERVVPEDLDSIQQAVSRAIEERTQYSAEYRIIRPDGDERWIAAMGQPVYDETGTAVRMIGVNQEITERKQSEQRLRDSEEKYRHLVETSQDLIWSVDPHGRWTYLNEKATRRIYGYEPSEMLGRPFTDFMTPEQAEKDLTVFEEIKAGKSRVNYETVHLRKDGSPIVTNFSAIVLRDTKGDVLGVTGTASDITERKRAKEKLEYQAKFERVITEVSTGFINLSPEEIDTGINQALQILGEFARVDRSYIFQFYQNDEMISNTHEWCAHGIESQMHRLKDVPSDMLSWITERILKQETIHVRRITDLPPEADRIKGECRVQKIKSFIGVPLVSGGKCIGALGFDSVRQEKEWSEDMISLLKLAAHAIANALQRKQSEKTLQESEARYRALVESQVDLISRYKPDTTLTFVNDAYCQFYDKTRDELIGHSFLSMVAPELHEIVRKETEKMVKDPRPIAGEYLNYRQNGEECWIQWVVQGIVDENDRVVELQAVGRDITDRKKAEDALRQYKFMVESAHDAIFFKDRQSRYIIANEKTLKSFGLSREQVIGRNDYDIMPDREQAKKNVDDDHIVFETGEPKEVIKGMTGADGETIWFQAIKVPQFRENGDIIGLIGIARDITEHKKAEEALRESEEKYRSVIENANIGILVIQDGQRVFYNSRIYQMYGYTRKEYDNIDFMSIVHPEDRSYVADRIRQRLAGELNDLDRIEIRTISESGEIRWVEANSTVIQWEGRPAIQAFVSDITERKLAEEERELMIELLRLLNADSPKHELMRRVTTLLKDWSKCDAVGIRLQEGEDFPYFETSGFPEEFVSIENSLCAFDEKGELVRDSEGKPCLECMCGNIIRGRCDPAQPFFTEYGSFWTNSTTELLAGTSETDRLARTRNRCNTAGYESVALIPLRMGDETYGLLQFNDTRKKRFTPWKISLFERLAGNLAIGLAHKLAEDELRSYQSRLKAMASQLSSIQERERRQLAIELHDRITQSLAMVKLGLETTVDSFEDTETARKVKDIAGQVGKTIEDAYSLMLELSNPVLYEIGLKSALDTLLQSDLVKNCGIKCRLVAPKQSMKIGTDVRVALYQAARELLVNAIKHSKAKEIEIHLNQTHDGVAVTVKDDGVGFDPSGTGPPSRQGRFGLFNIRENIEGLGGDFTVVSEPGKSTSAKIWVPLSSKDLLTSKGGTNENTHC